VLKNLNYDSGKIKCNYCPLDEQAIIKFIYRKPQATQKEIAEAVDKSERTIKSLMIGLQEKKLIERSDSKNIGEWIVKGK
jgi:predicted HTH transcriptional regulator